MFQSSIKAVKKIEGDTGGEVGLLGTNRFLGRLGGSWSREPCGFRVGGQMNSDELVQLG